MPVSISQCVVISFLLGGSYDELTALKDTERLYTSKTVSMIYEVQLIIANRLDFETNGRISCF